MFRPFVAAVACGLAAVAIADTAQAQNFAPSWGQPVYLDAWGRPVGGSPLSEVETRAYVETGRWADGYHERPRVYVPDRAPTYGHRDRHGYGYDHDRRRYRGHASWRGGRGARPWQGYRDAWGYNDDRHPSARYGWRETRQRHRHSDGCECGDVYLYDR